MPGRCRGFTLLEILTVMVLIGVLLGLATVGLRAGPAQKARQYAHELVTMITQLRVKAVSDGAEYGVRFDDDGYRLMEWKEGQWFQRSAHPVGEGMSFRLELEGQALQLSHRADEPQLLILSSDETSAFALYFETADGPLLAVSSDGVNDPVIDGH
ncbi:type II secretion system minor pseudopilin GspH [Pseudomonas abietaniphila]|uniref:Type II secretion system protein H n=1 Tax=Pseudomonas abietaniphila TaxID=89065 RepID=A0A1G7WXE6_9PSED|nr:type II secretion system minor pseudopilin GspH [Pseudomonas abietaniphila]SDG76617.1 general secretion pathway protein H [Pseudomonas abietaniphila]